LKKSAKRKTKSWKRRRKSWKRRRFRKQSEIPG